jgi:hypothetical protein
MSPILTESDIRQLAHGRWSRGTWWERDAADAIAMGNVDFIKDRARRGIYLVRCWLTQPKRDENNDPESAESALLHYFVQPDDDEALHDHPWDFRTTILAGGYWEHLPPVDWKPGSELGPEWKARRIPHAAGETISHRAADLHCVGAVLGPTWTLVRTGRRVRDWGFHPPGERWQYWRAYLGLDDQVAQPAVQEARQ